MSAGLQAEDFTCNGHVEFGIPAQADQYLCRDGYAVGYDYQTKNPAWVAYHITGDGVSIRNRRSNSFKPDKTIPSQYRANLSDYSKSGYDRGHMAPSATMDYTPKAGKESFLLTNMAPQLPGLNRNGWRFLEKEIREWAVDHSELYVVTGPIYYGGPSKYIGDGVAVPDAFFKVVFDPLAFNAIAFISPHQKISKADLTSFITTVDHVEQVTDMDFNQLLSKNYENTMESTQWSLSDW
ncbi:DNA/RNA endonuclease G [Pelagibaculum spongiae]|uniref:Endonuclease n=2 Tax=Pelagibaculum spongiae TaxID=2080658 RepID=A0A2V1GS63_9GAMM|nr:DNA/RNA endonuclease G [Pelagibaculum spongiae]